MAAARRKVTREELKKDEVAEAIETFVQRVRNNAFRITVIVTVALVLIIGVVVLTQARERERQRINQLFIETHQLLAELPTIQDPAQQQQRVQSQMSQLEAFVTDDPGSEEAQRALYLLGNLHYRLGAYAEAEEVFRRYLEEAEPGIDEARGRVALGNALENRFYQTEDEELLNLAGAQYQEAIQDAPTLSYVQGQAKLDRARVLEVAGDDEAALTIYREVVEERPAPREAFFAEIEPEGEAGPDPLPATGNVLIDSVLRQVDEAMDPLSFEATARLRIEQIEARRELVAPEGALARRLPARAPSRPLEEEAPTTPTLTEAEPTTPTLTQTEPTTPTDADEQPPAELPAEPAADAAPADEATTPPAEPTPAVADDAATSPTTQDEATTPGGA